MYIVVYLLCEAAAHTLSAAGQALHTSPPFDALQDGPVSLQIIKLLDTPAPDL